MVEHSQLEVVREKLARGVGLASIACVGVGSPMMPHDLSWPLQGPSSPRRLLIAMPLEFDAVQESQYQ